MRLHVLPVIGQVAIDKLTTDHVAMVLSAAQANPRLSVRSVSYAIKVLRIALNDARRWGLISRNVAELVKLPKQRRHDVRVLTPDEARQLVKACGSEHLGPLVIAAMGTGMRLGEILALHWSEVDLDRRQLRVSRKLARVRGIGQVLGDTKSARGRRSISIAVAVAEALRSQQLSQSRDRAAAAAQWHESGYVFTTAYGTPHDQSNVRRTFRRILRQAGLPAIRPHDLRHSCASLLLAEGVPPRVVMEMLGHSRISVTMDTYTHVMPVLMKEAADAIDRSLGSER